MSPSLHPIHSSARCVVALRLSAGRCTVSVLGLPGGVQVRPSSYEVVGSRGWLARQVPAACAQPVVLPCWVESPQPVSHCDPRADHAPLLWALGLSQETDMELTF